MRKFSRRRIIGGGAAAALGLPTLSSFARAGEAQAPLRLVVVWTPNDAQWIQQYETPLVAGAALPVDLPAFLQPLDSYRDRIAVLGGISNVFENGHTSIGHSLTGIDWIGADSNHFWAGGVSVDQHIAQALGQEALSLGVVCGAKNGKGRLSYSAAETPVDPIEDPSVAFDALFADVGADADELAARRVRKHSVLDRVAADLEAFAQQVPAAQRPRLEQHLTSIRAIEQKVDDDLLASCDPSVPPSLAASDNSLVPELVRAQLGIIAQALGCGATRVATLQLGRSGGGFTPLWPDDGIEIGLDVHAIAHEHYLQPDNAGVLADAKAVEAWYSTQLAYLLAQLDAIPDVDGSTLLDNTLVVHVKELGRQHGTDPMTYVVAGGPSAIIGNRVWSFDGRPHNDLLLSLCHKMGVQDETFGDPSITTGPLEF
ncbi:MAG: DUF1552 domain-containing protein [Deltaproteobacteria bacterium]|nr:DUF1552 domain-containing protein [Nannocystaceae bacterium]